MNNSENNVTLICPLCFSEKSEGFYYPPTDFNNKVFSYHSCLSCNASFVYPFPEKEDYDKIYGVNDHSYLKNLKPGEKYKHSSVLPLFNHQRYQLNFFSSGNYWKGKKNLLDIGCGSGFYMNYARKFGLAATGIEYDENFASLMSEKTGLNILSFTEFEKQNTDVKFDIIHCGHILEHLEKPHEILEWAKKYAHSETIFIVDGPLEKNNSLATLIIKIGSKIRKRKMNHYPPQHLTFTDFNSQLAFFERNGFKKLRYKTEEQLFPLPDKPDFNSPSKLVMFFLAHFSVVFSRLIPRWGNVFHYAGKLL